MWRTEGSVELFIDASPTSVYACIADITRTGERSLECGRCEWLPGPTPGSRGARFRGRNQHGLARWSRVCEVTVADPGRAFAFRTLPERLDVSRRDSTIWGYRLTPLGTGTMVTHYYTIVRLPLWPFKVLYGWLLPHHTDMRPHMTHTLAVLRAQVERAESPRAD